MTHNETPMTFNENNVLTALNVSSWAHFSLPLSDDLQTSASAEQGMGFHNLSKTENFSLALLLMSLICSLK